MYGMTAAHKTLPIPVFAEVTNLENGKKVVVRINDRGPFHSDRIIDLTYTAARKLGFEKSGTAKIKLRVLEPVRNATFTGLSNDRSPAMTTQTHIAPKPRNSGGYEIPKGTYLQLGAYSEAARAEAFKMQIKNVSNYPVTIESVPQRNVFRVLLGPLKDNWDLVRLQQLFIQKGYQEPKVVYRKTQ
jgi:rare lipoprotein A